MNIQNLRVAAKAATAGIWSLRHCMHCLAFFFFFFLKQEQKYNFCTGGQKKYIYIVYTYKTSEIG